MSIARTVACLLVCVSALLIGCCAIGAAAEPKVELLWPQGAPGAIGAEDADQPTLSIWQPAADKANGCAVVICPGGGYQFLAVDHEGKQIAEWLNSLGVTAVMLKYRIAPRYKHPAPLDDLQRALRTVRARATEWKIDPHRVGVIGFSAGGHLASTAATHFDDGKPDATDPIEKLPCKPNFAILCYPVISLTTPYVHAGSRKNLLGNEPDEKLVQSLSNELQVTERTPPVFLFHTSEDKSVPPEHSVLFYLALRKANIPAELHIYEKGRHGVGLAQSDPVLATWPARCADWLKSRGWIGPPKYVAADPKDATDPDFLVQGEYAGQIRTDGGPLNVGVQVIALGKGMFRAVGYAGGLPGDGWDRSDKHEFEGATKGSETKFEGAAAILTIRDGQLTVADLGGTELGRLTRAERKSSTLGQKPPPGAVVLFDGRSSEAFEGGRLTADGLLIPAVTSRQKFSSGTLHVEFRTPYQPEDHGQARGNSGCYVQGRYEVQILDSFGLAGKHNECGGIYSIRDPDLNMCYPPLAWQTYDIEFTAARYDADRKLQQPARITVRHNGVPIHSNFDLPDRETTAAPVKVGPEPGPIHLQDHGNPVRFRNVWFLEKR
ncbi:MAG: family 16 glycoside hydrolase [Planctomycetaceae bacterium]